MVPSRRIEEFSVHGYIKSEGGEKDENHVWALERIHC